MATEPRPPYSSLSTDSRRIKLVVSYDGTDFSGFAAQAGQRTVQSTLTEAVRRVTGEELELTGASRTDSGAHALGQVVHFDTATPIPDDRWSRALNRVLPGDLRVVSGEEVSGDFHSRFSAEWRHYRYTLLQSDRDPFRGRFAEVYEGRLDVSAMARAGSLLKGEHDFRGFTEELEPGIDNTRRTLFCVTVDKQSDETWVDVKGTAFMRGMMRRISGFLLEVGRGHRPAEDAEALLSENRDSIQWPVVLPAKGLCLREIRYKE